MRKLMHWLAAALLLLGMAGQSTVADTYDGISGTDDGLLRVGSTGILCVRSPCPWRGVARADATGVPNGELLWTGEVLPEIKAEAADLRRVREIWNEFGCILVDGRLDGSTLIIDRIAGSC